MLFVQLTFRTMAHVLKLFHVIVTILIRSNLADAIIDYGKDYVYVHCFGLTIDTVEPRPIVSVNRATFHYCPHLSSYAEALEALYVNVIAVQELHVIIRPKYDEQLNALHFKGLNIWSLGIDFYQSEGTYFPTNDYLMYLKNLTHLFLCGMGLLPLPNDTSLVKVELVNVTATELGGCNKLQELAIIQMDISGLSEGWLAHCEQLSSLSMEIISSINAQILDKFLRGLTSLVTFKVKNSKLLSLPEETNLFAGWTQIQHLDFSDNSLEYVKFGQLKSLQHLDLSNNKLDAQIIDLIEDQTSLFYLSLSGNYKLDPCRKLFPHIRKISVKHSNLERLHLAETATNELCFEKLENLKYLNLSDNNIKEIEFQRLPVSRKPLLEVDFRKNSIKSVVLDEKDYEYLRNGTSEYGFVRGKVKMLTSLSLGCDCENSWLSRALRENLVSLTRVACTDGSEMKAVSLEKLECDRYMCSGDAKNCTCRKRWHNQAVDANCDGANVQKMPRDLNLHSVYAPNNRIKNVVAEDFPETLLWVDLSNNLLLQIDPFTLETIFNVSSRRVRLAGNPFICDCDHRSLIETLQKHLEQVEDADDLKCFGTNKTLSAVDIAGLCAVPPRTWLTLLLVAGGVLIALLVLLAALYYEYQLKLLMFTYGCLSCVRDNDLDANRPYDAFISFSHADVDFVIDELLPGLEDGPQGYKVCVHFRDWVVGDWIPAQITRSVEQSRRTIIVLSEHFLSSTWGLLEFRTAHETAVMEGRKRIIVVALDDAVNNDARLDSELRTYLRNNTYLKWADKWFWEKLRYALPRRCSDGVPDQDPVELVGSQLRSLRNCSTVH